MPPTGKRQERFLPVEVLLCFALFYELRPNRSGGANIHMVPICVKQLASLFRRSPGSIVNKMLNLESRRANGGVFEPALYAELVRSPRRHLELYRTVIRTGRLEGLDEAVLPDFLGAVDQAFEVLGQDELSGLDLPHLLAAEVDDLCRRGLGESETVRVVEHRARVGQHRFARAVLTNFGHRCGFCGLEAGELPGHRLIVASHIKPWATCDARERLDYRNGIAACPTHDAAFDTGLLTVNGGLRIHHAPRLKAAIRRRPSLDSQLGSGVRPNLLVPEGSAEPASRYLVHHRSHIFRAEGVAVESQPSLDY